MRPAVLLLSSSLTLLALASVVACSADPASGSVQIDPVNSCTGDDCADAGRHTHADAGNSDDTPPPAGSDPDAGSSEGGTTTPITTPPGAASTCQTATDLGQMAAELVYAGAGGEQKSAQGKCSQWVKLRANETVFGWVNFGIKATLVSPPSTKFDLYGYLDVDADQISCTNPTASSASTVSNVDTAEVDWNDSFLKSDDSRTVTFEIRSRNGKCDANATWSLLIANGASVE